jgi:hypothetical protein
MIRDRKLLEEFEKREHREERLSHAQALRLFEAMWREAAALGVLPPEDPLEGIEADIRLARVLNSCSKG